MTRRADMAACLMALMALPSAAQTWAGVSSRERLERLVVMVRTERGPDTSLGGAILIGASGDGLYAATADHVVRDVVSNSLSDVKIRFRWRAEFLQAAVVLEDAQLDLAIVKIGCRPQTCVDPKEMSSYLLAEGPTVNVGDTAHAVGFPKSRLWFSNVTPERVAHREKNRVDFESIYLENGFSGGALAAADWALIGMVQSDNPPLGAALTIKAILDRAQGLPMSAKLGQDREMPKLRSVALGNGYFCGVTENRAAICSQPQWRTDAGYLQYAGVFAGDGRACGLTVAGDLYCWGRTKDIGLSDQIQPERLATESKFSALSLSGSWVCGLSAAGLASCWGKILEGKDFFNIMSRQNVTPESIPKWENSTTPIQVSPQLRFSQISAAENWACAVSLSAAVYCWGQTYANVFGTTTLGLSREPRLALDDDVRQATPPFQTVSVNQRVACGLTRSLDAYCWPASNRRVVPDKIAGGIQFTSISVGGPYPCALTADGRVYGWAYSERAAQPVTPVLLSNDLRFRQIDGQGQRTCGVTLDGLLYCWGVIEGARSRTNSPSPLRVTQY